MIKQASWFLRLLLLYSVKWSSHHQCSCKSADDRQINFGCWWHTVCRGTWRFSTISRHYARKVIHCTFSNDRVHTTYAYGKLALFTHHLCEHSCTSVQLAVNVVGLLVKYAEITGWFCALLVLFYGLLKYIWCVLNLVMVWCIVLSIVILMAYRNVSVSGYFFLRWIR